IFYVTCNKEVNNMTLVDFCIFLKSALLLKSNLLVTRNNLEKTKINPYDFLIDNKIKENSTFGDKNESLRNIDVSDLEKKRPPPPSNKSEYQKKQVSNSQMNPIIEDKTEKNSTSPDSNQYIDKGSPEKKAGTFTSCESTKSTFDTKFTESTSPSDDTMCQEDYLNIYNEKSLELEKLKKYSLTLSDNIKDIDSALSTLQLDIQEKNTLINSVEKKKSTLNDLHRQKVELESEMKTLKNES
ncbi:MAG: hypothetical protein MHPSP_002260, partial [Paramarteilia canceri]